jgi:ERCC4-type nuclease
MEIQIDYRERKIIEILNSKEIQHKIFTMDIGDILIGNILIERKTLADLVASIKDGRYHEQKARLKQYQGKVIFLIEGFLERSNSNYDMILGSMVSIQFKDNFLVYQTKNLEESVEFILRVIKKYDEFNLQLGGEYFDSVSVKKKDNFTPELYYLSILCEIPGVSKNIAQEIQNICPSLPVLIEYLKNGNKLASIQTNYSTGRKRKIGEKVEANIRQYLGIA